MNKNFNLENAKSIIAEASGVPVNTTFGSITKPIDLLLEVIDMSADLIALIHEETELKKHHRAYLHVHEELEDCADQMAERMQEIFDETTDCALPGFVDSKNEEKTERNAGYLVVSHSGGGMLRQGTRKGIRRTPANRGMRAHRIVKSLDISEDVCHGLCP